MTHQQRYGMLGIVAVLVLVITAVTFTRSDLLRSQTSVAPPPASTGELFPQGEAGPNYAKLVFKRGIAANQEPPLWLASGEVHLEIDNRNGQIIDIGDQAILVLESRYTNSWWGNILHEGQPITVSHFDRRVEASTNLGSPDPFIALWVRGGKKEPGDHFRFVTSLWRNNRDPIQGAENRLTATIELWRRNSIGSWTPLEFTTTVDVADALRDAESRDNGTGSEVVVYRPLRWTGRSPN